MIVLPEDETPQDASSPNERTPLKSPAAPGSPTSPANAQPPRELSSPPPPPYGVAISSPPTVPGSLHNQTPWLAASGSHSPHPPYSPHPLGPTAADEPSPGEVRSRVLKRLFTAYLVAWVILVLWTTFIGNLPHHHLDDYGPGTFLDSWVTDYIESISIYPRTGNEDATSGPISKPSRPRYGSGRGRRGGCDDPTCTCTCHPKKPSVTSTFTFTSTHPIVTIKPTPTLPPLRPLPIDYPPLYPNSRNDVKTEQKSEGESVS